LFSTVPQAAPCIRQLLDEVRTSWRCPESETTDSSFLPSFLQLFNLPVELREGYLFHSMRILTRKAIVLIKYVDAKCTNEGVGGLEDSGVKKLKQDLDIITDSDLDVLLGIAEKLSTGIYFAVRGDPSSIEDRLRTVFDIF
jgi:hypothetical protein